MLLEIENVQTFQAMVLQEFVRHLDKCHPLLLALLLA